MKGKFIINKHTADLRKEYFTNMGFSYDNQTTNLVKIIATLYPTIALMCTHIQGLYEQVIDFYHTYISIINFMHINL